MVNFTRLAFFACLVLSASAAQANLILNGDFETNSAASTRFNLTNSAFNGLVANATAFGTSEEIDLVTGTDFGIQPQSGSWKLGLHERSNVAGNFDGFSLDLASSIVAGMTFDLQFFAAGLAGSPLAAIQIGLSNSATDFGSLLFSGTPTGSTEWSPFNFNFTAASGASFLTVRNDPNVFNGYVFVDNISLVASSAVPEPSTLLLLGSGLVAIGGFAWRDHRRG